MPSLSPPPSHQLTSQPSLAPSVTVKSSQNALRLKTSFGNLKESDADAKLRDRGPSPTAAPAFGGKRKVGKTDLGLRRRDWILVTTVCTLGALVRLHHLSWPTSVVFDEVHFGGFASKYIRQVFFMDVHPPLAKLLITLSAKIGGFDGNFDFKDIGKWVFGVKISIVLGMLSFLFGSFSSIDYLEPGVPYVTMRLLPAMLGLALIPLTFFTLLALRMSLATALLGSLLITFDNALIAQSRLILLDSYLVFFTALTIYFWVRFANLDAEGQAFTRNWWQYLILTGTALGAAFSCKWVGLFTIATIGLGTLRQLWLLLGNLKVTPRMWIKHFAARTVGLIVTPAIFYMGMFQIHFLILNRSGDGDGFMSSEFQHTLIGHGMDDTFADVGYGSHVTIRHVHTQGGYLHSHASAYPGGSQQQQITLYPHRDDNNIWRIINASAPDAPVEYPWDELPFEKVLTGSKVRLEHISTGKRLHSHDIRPPVSEVDFQNEVSGYGFDGFAGDANDDFVVEIAPKTRSRDKQARHRLRTLRSEFRLRHAMTGCYLFSHKVKLPEWGFEQQEVTCNKNPTWENSLWYIETNVHAQLPFDAEKVNYQRPSFLAKFWELQTVMWTTNAGLTERHAYDSRPQHWPWMRRGINFWVQDHRQVYLIGNPIVWWSSTLGVVAYLVSRGLLVVRAKRGYRDLHQPKIAFYDEACGFLVIAWALHYLPFFLMQRQLFLHHYLPALWFAILCFCAIFDFLTSRLRPRTRFQIASIVLILVIWSWSHYSPLTYAKDWTRGKCEKAKWLKSWDFSCADFHEDYSLYRPHQPVPSDQVLVSNAIGPDSATTTLVDEAPEPIKNAFDDPNAPPEEKTVAPVGPVNEIQMNPSTSAVTQEPAPEKLEDLRQPVGLDAGAPEVTDVAENVGGWHGGAEENNKREQEMFREGGEDAGKQKERERLGQPQDGGINIRLMEADDEARRLADAAMRADEA